MSVKYTEYQEVKQKFHCSLSANKFNMRLKFIFSLISPKYLMLGTRSFKGETSQTNGSNSRGVLA